MRIFYWCLDGMIHAMYQVVKHIAKEEKEKEKKEKKEKTGNKHKWLKYLDKQLGRHRFQMDLGNDLMKAGIAMDWKDPTDDKQRPACIDRSIGFPATARSASSVSMDSLVELHTRQEEPRETHHPMPGLSVQKRELTLTEALNNASCLWRQQRRRILG